MKGRDGGVGFVGWGIIGLKGKVVRNFSQVERQWGWGGISTEKQEKGAAKERESGGGAGKWKRSGWEGKRGGGVIRIQLPSISPPALSIPLRFHFPAPSRHVSSSLFLPQGSLISACLSILPSAPPSSSPPFSFHAKLFYPTCNP